eukprot:6176065-Pleurochrysis_carterae.AAC.2
MKQTGWAQSTARARAGAGAWQPRPRSGVQLLCESRVYHRRSCLLMKGEGQTRAVGSGSPRKWWDRP